jgi:O-methyltransferase involved in polyketide biosynthesis
MRAKFIDEIVLGEATAGLDELILLGAGLDSPSSTTAAGPCDFVLRKC